MFFGTSMTFWFWMLRND